MNYRIKIIPVGFLETNCYALLSKDSVILIDPGDESEKIIKNLEGRPPDIILLTHAHADHIGGIEGIKKKFPSVPVMAHPLEFPALGDPSKNLSLFEGENIISPPADKSIEDGSIIISDGGDIKLKVIHTPGHTTGSVCFWDEENKVVFTGDTIFKETIGRVDLPGGSEEAMFRSIKRFIKMLSNFSGDDVVIYPGHGPSTTLTHEKKHNPYFQEEKL